MMTTTPPPPPLVKFGSQQIKTSFSIRDAIQNPQCIDDFHQAKEHLYDSTKRIINDKDIDLNTLLDIEKEAIAAKEAYKKQNVAEASQMNYASSFIGNIVYATTLISIVGAGLYLLLTPIAFFLSSISNLYINIKQEGINKKNLCLSVGALIALTFTVGAILLLTGVSLPISPYVIILGCLVSDLVIGATASQLQQNSHDKQTKEVAKKIQEITSFIHQVEHNKKPQQPQKKTALQASLAAHTYELCDRVREIKDPKEKKAYAQQLSNIKYTRVIDLIKQRQTTPSGQPSTYQQTLQTLLLIQSNPQTVKDIKKYQKQAKKGIASPPQSLAQFDKKLLDNYKNTALFSPGGSQRGKSNKKRITQLTLAARILSLSLPPKETQQYLHIVTTLPKQSAAINNILAKIKAKDPVVGKQLFAAHHDAKNILQSIEKDRVLTTLQEAESHINKYARRETPFVIFETITTVEVLLYLVAGVVALPFLASPPVIIGLAAAFSLHCAIAISNFAYDKSATVRNIVTAGQNSYETVIDKVSTLKKACCKGIVQTVGLSTITQPSASTNRYAVKNQAQNPPCVSTKSIGSVACKSAPKSHSLQNTSNTPSPTQPPQDDKKSGLGPKFRTFCKMAKIAIKCMKK